MLGRDVLDKPSVQIYTKAQDTASRSNESRHDGLVDFQLEIENRVDSILFQHTVL